MTCIAANATQTITTEANVNKNTESALYYNKEPYKSQVYWLRGAQYIGLEALLAQQEKLAIQHMRSYIKSTHSKKPVEWTAYESDLLATHRDGSGQWRL